MNKDLENKILEVADLIYNTGYTAGSVESRPMGYEDGYKHGLNIAWKVAKLEGVFKCKPSDIYGMSASEALEKIKEFQKKDTCSRCVHNKCNTCVHKNEDNICCGCTNDSEYENDSEQPKQKCKTCDYYEPLTKEWFKCNAKGDCKDYEQWKSKIELGDEVIHETGSKGIVVGIDSENFYLLTSDYNVPQEVSKEGYTKTGRYFPQIQELRDQLYKS